MHDMGTGDIKKLIKSPVAAQAATSGLPLAASMGALVGYGELFNKLDNYAPILNNPAFRFAAIVKLAGWTSIPIHVALEHAYSGGGASLATKIGQAYKKDLFLNGDKLLSWATAGKIATWFPRTTFGMGGGMLFANLGEYFFGDVIDKNLDGIPNEVAKMSFFFTEELANVFTFGGFSKLLANGAAKRVFTPLAVMNGAGFTAQMMDYGVSALIFGGREANYMNSVSFRTAQTPHWADKLLLPVMGLGFKAHMVSGRGLGAVVDRMQDAAAYLGLIDEENKYYNIRNRIYEEDERNSKGYAEGIKGEFRVLLATEGIRDWNTAVWRSKISAGWLNDVDLGSFNHACNPDIQQAAKSIAEIALLVTPSTEVIRKIFSKDVLGLEKDEQLSSGAAILANGMEDEFLNWLGGKDVILKLRRRMLVQSLIEADMRRLQGSATSDDTELLEVGARAGFNLNDAAFFEELERMLSAARLANDHMQLQALNDYLGHKVATLGPAAIETAMAGKRNVYSELEMNVRGQVAKDIAAEIVISYPLYIETLPLHPILSEMTVTNRYLAELSEFAAGAGMSIDDTAALKRLEMDIKSELKKLTGRNEEPKHWFKASSLMAKRGADSLKTNIARQWVAAVILSSIDDGNASKKFAELMQMETNKFIFDEARGVAAAYRMLGDRASEVRGSLKPSAATKSTSCTADPSRLERQELNEQIKESQERENFKDHLSLSEAFTSGALTRDGHLGELEPLKKWFAKEAAKVIDEQISSYEKRIAEIKGAEKIDLTLLAILTKAIEILKI